MASSEDVLSFLSIDVVLVFAFYPPRPPPASVSQRLKTHPSFQGDWEKFIHWSCEPQILSVIPFGKYKGKKFGEMPSGYVNFITKKFDDPDMDLKASVLHYFGKVFKKHDPDTQWVDWMKNADD